MDCIHKMRASAFWKRLLLFSVLFVLCAGFAAAQRGNPPNGLRIRLASPIPDGTRYGEALTKAAADIAALCGRDIELRVYRNGVRGNNHEMLEGLRVNTIQAALFIVRPEEKSFLEISGCFFIFKNDISALAVNDYTWAKIPEKYRQGIIEAFKPLGDAILRDRDMLIYTWYHICPRCGREMGVVFPRPDCWDCGWRINAP